ncbi:MAG: dienelactone hydrolase family protein [Sagittula sp.]|uniref:dienelactone hydrolase family protein n=1 Tax=Sagittula sp. TaxID=2038081 RepID=UPI0040595DD1
MGWLRYAVVSGSAVAVVVALSLVWAQGMRAAQPVVAPVAGHYVERMVPELHGGPVYSYEYAPPTDIGETHVMPCRFWSGKGPRRWIGFGPVNGAPRPTVVLLHDAGRDGHAMIDMWDEVARREGLILIAPDSSDPKGWAMEDSGPAFLRRLLEEAGQVHPIDADRVFLMGHGTGAVMADNLARRGDPTWRAVATHGGHGSDPVAPDGRRMPVFVYLGEGDHLFPLDGHRDALKALQQSGHDVTLTVIPDHTHWYYTLGLRLSADIWHSFEATLPPPRSFPEAAAIPSGLPVTLGSRLTVRKGQTATGDAR